MPKEIKIVKLKPVKLKNKEKYKKLEKQKDTFVRGIMKEGKEKI